MMNLKTKKLIAALLIASQVCSPQAAVQISPRKRPENRGRYMDESLDGRKWI
ncbi:MAG: hypothetical protein ACLUIQ_02945 [Dialister invisus]